MLVYGQVVGKLSPVDFMRLYHEMNHADGKEAQQKQVRGK
jgi:hypothetical protein